TDYTATPDAYFTSRNLSSQAEEFPTLYALWPINRGGTAGFAGIADGQVFKITPNFANTTADIFTFTPPAPSRSMDLEKASIKRVGVFPNPYYAFNPAEINRFVRFVTFSNLPPTVKIRIFNLAGQLVRTLDKSDNSQFLRWDLNNENHFPVASGLYVAYVELTLSDGSVETKVVKLGIIQEQEVPDIF
ncbi:MAG: T9SS type A sorting domain-containing protein, partial [Bacteroidota bacterium]